jgi:hypothetical protein
MKNLASLFFLMCFFSAPIFSQNVLNTQDNQLINANAFPAPKVTISNNKFTVAGNEIWFNGINTPWHLFDDFGRTDFNPQWWTEEFQRYSDNHINLARVWIHGSGEISPNIDKTGYVSGASDLFWQHMDTLIEVSRTNKIYILPVLLSFDITKNTYSTYERWRAFLQDSDNIQSYIDNVLIPLVQRYEDEPYLLGWEICNEPEWMFENTEHGPQAFEDVQRMHAMLAAAIHENSSAYVTTGSAAPKWNSPIYDSWGDNEGNMFSDEALSSIINNSNAYLDFYQYHWYPWQTQWMDSPFTKSTDEYQVDDRPVIVGESEGNNVCDDYICQTIPEMYENAYLNGFDGVCAWKTPQNDGHGTFENIAVATNSFYNDHPDLVYPPTDTIAVEGIDLVEDSLSIEVNDVYTLSVTITPSNASNQNITWSSSDSRVATISEGSVTGISEGTSLITATAEDGGYTDYCFITVLPETPKPTYTLIVNNDGNGTVSIEPQDTIYEEGTVVTLTAVPNTGFKFSYWSGDLDSELSVASIIMDGNKTIMANFAEITTPCENPDTITIPFSFNGAGDYCWVTDQTPSYINSWNLDLLEINNVDFTNSWAGNLPDPINDYYYIHYVGSYDWSHFEAPQTKSAGTTIPEKKDEETGTVIFPNPFSEAINICIPDYNNIKKITITDLSGRIVETIYPDNERIHAGQSLSSGTYLVIIHYPQKNNVYKIMKQ